MHQELDKHMEVVLVVAPGLCDFREPDGPQIFFFFFCRHHGPPSLFPKDREVVEDPLQLLVAIDVTT